MNRKTFFQKFFQGGLMATLVSGLKIPGLRADDGGGDAASPSPQDQFRHRWIGSLLKQFSAKGNSEGVAILESCGRDCARSGAIQMALEADKNVDNLLKTLETHLGDGNAVRDGKQITIHYPKCYCPMVSGMTPQKDSAWCNCSRGWLLEMFETVTGKPVQVELQQSILRGDERCRFEIRIS